MENNLRPTPVEIAWAAINPLVYQYYQKDHLHMKRYHQIMTTLIVFKVLLW